jgi:hypothetical protein
MTFKIKFRLSFLLISGLLILLVSGCSKPDLSTEGKNLDCYAATCSKGIFKSDNGGISWYPLTSDQDDLYLYSKKLFMSPDSKRLYVTTSGAGLFYFDMEKGILNTGSGFKNEDIKAVAFKKTLTGQGAGYETIAGKRETGIVKSIDGISSWKLLNKGLTYHDVNTLFDGSANLFAGTVNGVFRWDENSKSWIDSSQGLENRNICSFAASPDGKTIYAGVGVYQDRKGRFKSISSFYKSANNGSTWDTSDKGLPDGVLVFSIAVNPQRSERIYLGTSEGVYRSIDGGSKWSKIDAGLPRKFKALDVKIAHVSGDKALVYAGGANGLYVAIDDDKTFWASRSYGLDNTYVSSILVQNN